MSSGFAVAQHIRRGKTTADTRRCLADYLQALGHTVTTAGTTTQALETPALGLCDVLVSNLRFPVGDGWELLRTIRRFRPIYAIAISGLGTPADRARSRTAGFQHHLLKPFPLGELDAALEKAMSEVKAMASSRGDTHVGEPLWSVARALLKPNAGGA